MISRTDHSADFLAIFDLSVPVRTHCIVIQLACDPRRRTETSSSVEYVTLAFILLKYFNPAMIARQWYFLHYILCFFFMWLHYAVIFGFSKFCYFMDSSLTTNTKSELAGIVPAAWDPYAISAGIAKRLVPPTFIPTRP
jgi:hypothetical protein